MENRFCTHCGTALAGQVFCPNCGVEAGSSYEGRCVIQQGTYGPPPQHISDYLVWSIISVLYAGILGIVALVFSILCRSDLSAGRYDSAMQNSNAAFWCNAIALGLFVFGVVLVFFFFCLIGMIGFLR